MKLHPIRVIGANRGEMSGLTYCAVKPVLHFLHRDHQGGGGHTMFKSIVAGHANCLRKTVALHYDSGETAPCVLVRSDIVRNLSIWIHGLTSRPLWFPVPPLCRSAEKHAMTRYGFLVPKNP